MKITKYRVARGIYLLKFKTQYELTSTFLRIQEHYESPRFHGRIFSLEQYMDWYAAEKGNFTYYQDWSGFNVPSTAFQPFYDGTFDPLSEKEKHLLGLFAKLKERFYVIGIYEAGSLTHELAHALYFTDEAYRKAVQVEMRKYDTSRLARQIADAGYAEHVVPDEMQAYIVSPSSGLGSKLGPLTPARRKLRQLFRRHSVEFKAPKIK
jgi:hypothetical protein